MLGKARPTVSGKKTAAAEPRTGLSEGRIALVHRYMIDAEEAEARDTAAAEYALAQAEMRAAAEEQAQREATERARMRTERGRRQSKELFAAGPAADPATYAPANDQRPGVKGDAEARKAVAKAEKRSAKEAARQLAALEKREARERKALAKAAARRRAR